MKVQDVMVKSVEVCAPEESLNRAAQLMWEHDCGCVPVVDSSRRIIGIVTDRDVCMACYTRGLPPAAIGVESIMTKQIQTCEADDPIEVAEEIMRSYRIRRVPVVDSESRIIGIVSLNDLALTAEHERRVSPRRVADKLHVAETLAAVCEHRSQEQLAAASASA